MANTVLPWAQYTEAVVGLNHPTLADVDNRALRAMLARSSFQVDATFRGLPVGSSATNAGSSDYTGTAPARVTAAVADAVAVGLPYCFVPRIAWDGLVLLPYNASLATFNTAVIMLCEGGSLGPNLFDSRAYGCEGSSVATGGIASDVAINAAITAASTFQGGGIVLLPPGNIKITAPVNLKVNVSIRGAGQAQIGNASTLLWTTSGTGTVVFTAGSIASANIVLSDFTIDAASAGVVVGTGIDITNATNVVIERVTVQNAATLTGIRLNNCESSSLRRVSVFSCLTGVSFVNLSNNNDIQDCIFVPVATGTSINLDSTTQQTLIQGCDFEGASLATTTAIKVNGARGTTIIGNYVEFYTTNAILVAVNSRNTTLIGNVLHATSAATYVVIAQSAINLTAINNEFPNLGVAGTASTGIIIGNVATNSSFLFGNRLSGGGAGTVVMLGDGTALTGTDMMWADTPVFTLTDAATIAVNAMVGPAVKVTIAGNRTMGAPTVPTNGQRMHFTIVQDGVGGRTLAWNAVFKVTWSDAGNTLGKRSSVAFVYDGTSWNQDGAQSPYV